MLHNTSLCRCGKYFDFFLRDLFATALKWHLNTLIRLRKIPPESCIAFRTSPLLDFAALFKGNLPSAHSILSQGVKFVLSLYGIRSTDQNVDNKSLAPITRKQLFCCAPALQSVLALKIS